MNNDHTGCTRGFYHTGASWYAKAVLASDRGTIDSITMGMYDLTGGGTTGEFSMNWTELCGAPTPRLDIFSDAWNVLPLFSDVLAKLAALEEEDPSPGTICALLLECGLKDLTQRKQRTSEYEYP